MKNILKDENGMVILNPKVVYVLLSKDGTVKVGITEDFETRKNTVQTSSGKIITDSYHTEICSNASEIEALAKKHFAQKNICGEWFDCKYEEMVNFVKTSYKENGITKKVTEYDYMEYYEKCFQNLKTALGFEKEKRNSETEYYKYFSIITKEFYSMILCRKEFCKTIGNSEEYETFEKARLIISEGLMTLRDFISGDDFDYLFFLLPTEVENSVYDYFSDEVNDTNAQLKF